MMETAETLSATERTELGKGPSRRLRASGSIPAVCYGSNIDTIHLAVDPDDIRTRLTGRLGLNVIFQIKTDEGAEHLVRVGNYQRDPVKRDITHVDFVVVDPDKPIVAEVPLALTGKPIGIDKGGRLRQLRWTVKIMACPQDIPAGMELDVTELDIGQVLKVSAVALPERVTLEIKQDYGVAQVYLPRGEDEEEEEEEGEEGDEEGEEEDEAGAEA